MKTIAIIATTLAFACGCSNAATLQGKLATEQSKNADLQSRLEIETSRVQEVKAESLKDADTCRTVMEKYHAAIDYASDELRAAVPVVENKAVELYNETKPKVSAAVDSAETWAKKQYDSHSITVK